MKRSHREGSSSSSTKIDHHKRIRSSSTSNPPTNSAQQQRHVANTHSLSVEKVVDDTGIRVTQEDVEEVLKLSYGFPGPAVKFFRWSGFQLNDKHSPYAWNLVVDLLGKNCLFDAMWDAIKSMKKEGLLSLATFASVFSSYVIADRVQEAIMTDGKAAKAKEFLSIVKDMIRPDADTYAILLEGWENEGDVPSARDTFSEMVIEIGWDPGNVPAYDSFLTTLLKGSDGMREVMKFFDMMKDRRCYPGTRFFKAALEYCVKKGDTRSAGLLWDASGWEKWF
ncbi:hypothetical protein F0562_004165 [Nyssa sinensis]|uniref:Pentacotripeptide-repeat region of PRORP domain-containing protein n=1 Tax=Nyssa sinensis TaxID=561372 RepID=A0A5J5BYL8_9ASTE|nr:hypothetical protein F0562_004165 [Nyssa sinensis]